MFSDELRFDLLVTALEGGSNYWYLIDDVSAIDDKGFSDEEEDFENALWRFIVEGGSLEIHDVENPTEKLGDLNIEGIINGEKVLEQEFNTFFTRIEDDNWDADDADAWFQCAVLGTLEFS